MTQNLKVNQIVPLGFGAVFFIMILIALVNRFNIATLVSTNGWVAHTYKVKANLNALEKDLVDAETGQRGFIITGKDDYLDPYNRSVKIVKDDLMELRNEVRDNPTQIKNIARLEELVQEKLEELQETINLKRSGQEEKSTALVLSGKGKAVMDEIRSLILQMGQIEDELLSDRQTAAAQAEQLSNLVSFGGTFFAIVCGFFVSRFIAQSIMQPISEVVNALVSSSSEIAATTEQQERTAAQQAVSVNQTTTTMDELNASSQQAAQQAEAAASGATQGLTMTERGAQAVKDTLERMALLKDKVGSMQGQILHLSEQTSQIGNISSLVSDLANQTNMLALNAAVEAVRAGEHGRGFAVVASEIRKLADQSKQSAQKINVLVADIQNAINSSVMVTDEGTKTVEEGVIIAQGTAEAFTGVTTAINSISLNSQQISLSAKQQAVAIQQVVEAMNALNVAATETATGISQTKIGVQKLNEAALTLKTLV